MKLNSNDFIRGAATAVFASIVAVIYGVVFKEGFDLFSVDWAEIARMVVNAAIYSFVGYMSKNMLTAENGKIFGKI